MRFVKLEALGNDFILLECAERPSECAALVRSLCDRKRGAGADGVLLALPGEGAADARVEIWNADGSEAEISGNGVRCAARWLADARPAAAPSGDAFRSLTISTRSGVVSVNVPRDARGGIRIPLGEPRLRPDEIPMRAPGERFIESRLDGVPIPVTALSLGNPHAVLFVDGPVAAARYGPLIESHALFPARTNVEFVRVVARDHLLVLVWERGVGPTASSGTGAAAALAAAVLTGRAERCARIEMEGGTFDAGWDESGVWTEGPAREVYRGDWLG
ncbi:MAG: diaminopimelate epimerase [bacterium]